MAFPTTTSAYEMDGVGVVDSAVNSVASQINRINQIAESNSARSAQEARIQREWQEVQNAKAMAFNAAEAAKTRNWQEMMSNTAHQREIADLKAAGLNPVLSAMGGNGAAVTSGATASGVTSAGAKGDVDTSVNSALVNLLGSIYNRTTQLEAANINARTQEAVADKYNATSEIVAQIGAAATKYASDRSEWRANANFVGDVAKDLLGDSMINSAVSAGRDVARNIGNKVSDWWDSTDDKYRKYKSEGADNMSFGELTSALVGSIKNIFK